MVLLALTRCRRVAFPNDDLLDRPRHSWLLFQKTSVGKQSWYVTSAHSARKLFPQHLALLCFALIAGSRSCATAFWRSPLAKFRAAAERSFQPLRRARRRACQCTRTERHAAGRLRDRHALFPRRSSSDGFHTRQLHRYVSADSAWRI